MPDAVPRRRRKFLPPEVVQTSQMDCGPAVLKTLMEGYGEKVNLGRLREACQTEVDGTSVDVLEDVARRLGLDAVQIQEPIDHFLLPEADILPAVVITSKPAGRHFEVAWRRFGSFVLTMDPATGRRWRRISEFAESVYQHVATIPATVWREYAGSESFLRVLSARCRQLGVDGARLIEQALEDPTWRSIAALDAATRATTMLVHSGLRRGREAQQAIEQLSVAASEDAYLKEGRCARQFWSAWPAALTDEEADDAIEGEEQLLVRGAVLVRIRGEPDEEPLDADEVEESISGGVGADEEAESPANDSLGVSVELRAAVSEPQESAFSIVWKIVRESGLWAPVALSFGLGAYALAAFVQALILRGLFDVGRRLGGAWQAAGGTIAILMFLAVAGTLDGPIASVTRRLGRGMDGRLRRRLLEKLPRLGDHYFRSRPRGDMALRAHDIAVLRDLPAVATGVTRVGLQFLVTVSALVWLNPAAAGTVVALSALILIVPLVAVPTLLEREMSVQTHSGALFSQHLDVLLGLTPTRTHGAETALLREHESKLSAWTEAVQRRRLTSLTVDVVQRFVSVVATVAIVAQSVRISQDPRSLLLFLYWSLLLPAYATQLADILLQVPGLRTSLLRALEPIGALEDTRDVSLNPVAEETSERGISLEYRDVTVRASGNTVLSGLDLTVRAGEHIAIVGTSGAGKSSMIGVLLGHHRVSEGEVVVDGRPLDADVLDFVRDNAAWVDPEIHIWNRSLLDNIEYGARDVSTSVSDVLENADLIDVVERLPGGLQERLGEGGALVSGGQGQRIRLARALRRRKARLVLFDEGFRGLDRDKRRVLLQRAREVWKHATLLCVTHDIDMACTFPRVVVVDRGRVVEADSPTVLVAKRSSRFASMFAAEVAQQRGLLQNPMWRRVRLDGGRVVEDSPGARRGTA